MTLTTTILVIIAALIFVVALMYSTVGHAGASGYLAAMALFGIAPIVMKPTALVLNIMVAIIGTIRFHRAGFFSWRLFWPFAITSIPASFIGGGLSLPVPIYKSIVGLVLLYSAVRLFFSARLADQKQTRPAPIANALIIGAAIGLISGLTGVGGGIFLSPDYSFDALGQSERNFRRGRNFHPGKFDSGIAGAPVVNCNGARRDYLLGARRNRRRLDWN